MTNVRRLDKLGRIVIPKEIRKKMSMNPGDEIEIDCLDHCLLLALCKDQICKCCGNHCEIEFQYCPYCGELIHRA